MDDELALFFSAKQENEELKKAILNDHREIERLRKHIKSLISASTYLKDQYSQMLSFIKLLDKYPMFWGRSYKGYIKRFLNR